MPPKIHQRVKDDGKNGDDLGSRDNVLVCVRMRPMNRKERKSHQKVAWALEGKQIIQKDMTKSEGKAPQKFTYDNLWGPDISNCDIFKKIGFSVIKATMEGFHGVVFAYGQTSSGKTHSIHGSENDPGMIPRAVQAMFEYIENTTDRDFLIQVSYMEIYNEAIKDLVNPTGKSLNVREHPKKGIFVDGLTSNTVCSTEQIYALLAQGESHRHIGKTDYNAVSSRSHTIFQVMVESQSTLPTNKQVLQSKLNLVDLAGSENTSKVGSANKARLGETGNINKSLLALASVIWKISEPEGKRGHIPYRDSKLTRVLQESLNGTACISILCCLSPSSGNIDESITTLKFASRAKSIKNSAKKNVKEADAKTLIAKYKAEIEELKMALLNADSARPGQVSDNLSASAAPAPTELENQLRDAQAKKEEYRNQIEHLNKIILKSPFQGNMTGGGGLQQSSYSREPNCRRPSYFNMGSRIAASTAAPDRRHSTFSARSLLVMGQGTPANKTPTIHKGKRLIRSGSLGLTHETGIDDIDDLLCLPAKVQVHFEKEKVKKAVAELTGKSEEVAQLALIIEEKDSWIEQQNGIIDEKDKEISYMAEEIEDQLQEMKTKDYEIETYIQSIRELEEKLDEYEMKEQEQKGEKAQLEKKNGDKVVEEIKSFKLITGLRSGRSTNSDSGPLIGFFLKNAMTGYFEYEGRTEWIKGLQDPIFTREFIVKNNLDLVMRFSVYDVDNEQLIDQGDFIGSTTLKLSDLVAKAENGEKAVFLEYDLETDNPNEKASLRVKLVPNNGSKQKKRRKIRAHENELRKENEELRQQIEALKLGKK